MLTGFAQLTALLGLLPIETSGGVHQSFVLMLL
jgi:hypothetical protein